MTRKSPPASRKIDCFVVILWACAVASAPGCSLLSPKKSSFLDYEQTRQSIDDPDSFYRPEGKSAERENRTTDFLQRLGVRTSRRKDMDVARSHYAAADEQFEAAKALEGEARVDAFRKAAEQYRLAAENWQSSGLEQDALLMAAEAHFFAEDYYRAENLYAELIKEYPRNPYLDHVDSRRFAIADFWLKYEMAKKTPFVIVNFTDNKLPWNDTGGHGKQILEKMRLDNPTGKVSDDATMRLAMEDFENGRYESAADTFADLRMTYPDSEHQFNAQFLELQSLLASYQGPKYSSIPLTEAQKRVKQLVKQFPDEARQRQEDLQKAYAQVRYLMAQRVWNQAQYRHDRRENDSARFHYRRILEEYSDTPFAEQAQQKLDDLKGEPDNPPQRFKTLIWLFGASADDRPWRKSDDAQAN